jgi:hypothetical protein
VGVEEATTEPELSKVKILLVPPFVILRLLVMEIAVDEA